jgi:hypothetical protein
MEVKQQRTLENHKVAKIHPWITVLKKLQVWSLNFQRLAVLVPQIKSWKIIIYGPCIIKLGMSQPFDNFGKGAISVLEIQ